VSDEDFNLEIRKRITDDSFLSDFNELKSTSFFPEIYLRNLQMEASSLELLCEALNKEATTDIRIVSNRDLVEQELIENEIQFGSNFVRDCLKLQTNTDFHTYQGYKRAYFDIQDEGSQLVSIVLDPKPGENILDYCSGGGGKTVHIAALSNDLANITATDVSSSRLENTKRRVEKHRFTSVKIVSKDYINKETAQYDKILADVPCSGSGTVRRIPEIRYLMRSDKIDNYARVQLEIVQICWKKLKPGGELTYSTCSLFPKENERVIAKFLNFHKNAELVSISDRLESLGISTDKLHFGEYGVTLLPHRTNTDGFFISVLKKRV
jgi:16S rRNA (cytosine967-C5)-methyltransferase